jgi:hypothetical protein
VITIAPSEVAVATRAGSPTSRIRRGTATMPPPTPKSAEKIPAASPMATRRTFVSYEAMRNAFSLRVALGGVMAVAAGVAGSMPATAGAPSVTAQGIYVARPDPRACPSPMCGGYWVSLANHARTPCHDGLLRPRCYVAVAASALTRQSLKAGLTGNALARGSIGSWKLEGFGDLGAIFVADVWSPVGHAPASGDFFDLRDTGIRCIRAPCFSFRARRLNRSAGTTVSGVHLGPARASPETLSRAEAALKTQDGLFAAGSVTATPDGGRTFRATQVYLRSATPHA